MIELPDLLKEVQKIWPHCDGIMKSENEFYFGLIRSDGGIEWFSHYQAPIRVQLYLDAYGKMER